jgi:hypothetical protein
MYTIKVFSFSNTNLEGLRRDVLSPYTRRVIIITTPTMMRGHKNHRDLSQTLMTDAKVRS